jgi:hypothetical protein
MGVQRGGANTEVVDGTAADEHCTGWGYRILKMNGERRQGPINQEE